MAVVYGLTDAGLVIKTLPIIIAEKEAEIRALFGDTSNVNPESNFGQLINISAEREDSMWQLFEQIYLAQYPNTSNKGALDQTVSMNGIIRNGVKFSTISQQAFWGTPATSVPAGTTIIIPGNTDSQYALNDTVVLGSGTNQIQTISLAPTPNTGFWTISFKGQTTSLLAHNITSGVLKIQLELLTNIDGVSITGDFTTSFVITFDGQNVEFRKNPLMTVDTSLLLSGVNAVVGTVVISTAGVYQALGLMTATVSGIVPKAPIYQLTELEVGISGIDRTSNEVASLNGADKETDADLKIRRLLSLSEFGGGTAEAVRAAVLKIDGVATCFVYENDTNAFVFGRPPTSFETFVLQTAEIGGGLPDSTIDDLVGVAIFNNKPLGIESFGPISVGVIDTQGNPKTVFFNRPVGVSIFLIWELDVDPVLFPVDGATQIGNALIEYGNKLGQGVDIIVYPYLINVLDAFVGIIDTVTKIGKVVGPTTDDNVIIDNGSAGNVEISVWTGPNISFVINGVPWTFNPTTEEWEE